MPNAILLLILSRLRSTEEVNRTSILSRRWRYLWTSIPSIDISSSRHLGYFKRNCFKKFVYWVLVNKSVDLNRFRLYCPDQNYYGMSTVGRWIHAAVARNVKQLELSFCQDESEVIEMPHCLVTCGSLEVLRLDLRGNGVRLPNVIGFPALRVLELEFVDLLCGDSVKCFLESCPLLEDLALYLCSIKKSGLICISCPKLKKLKIHDEYYSRLMYGRLKISCPNLVFLVLNGDVVSDVLLERLDSLKEAVIVPGCFGNVDPPVLFPGISQVESLQTNISIFCKCFQAARDPALPNLKTLELTGERNDFFFDFTASELNQILKYCPKLESLSLFVENTSYEEGPEDLEWAEANEKFLTPDVKWVESFEYNGEKPKLDIQRYGNEWIHMIAKWGKETR